ncbi:MAG TPA: hypothetical protein VIA63_00845 [Candidatus Limnocylindria bacterium]|jgi:hypothetical protein
MKFTKSEFTRTVVGEEPMVFLDAAAITERIGRISRVEKAAPVPLYHTMSVRQQPYEAKWRRALKRAS